MRTFSFVAQKGGAGKTTLTIHCATLAAEQGSAVLLDLDPQQSASKWHERREAGGPLLGTVSAQHVGAALDEAAGAGAEAVFLDTAPHNNWDAMTAVRRADLVVVPCRPGMLDFDALGATLEILKREGAAAAFVINAAPPLRNSYAAPVVTEARALLAETGYPVFPGQITQRAAFADALNTGSAVHEFEPNGKAAAEIRALWRWLSEQ